MRAKALCIICLLSLVYGLNSCKKESINDPSELEQKLSSYGIFQGNISDLAPANGFYLYELGSTLFTDYSEKQRLIHLPGGTQFQTVDDGIPNFPEGTYFVKTFYYFNDKRDQSKGKKIIETRIIMKKNSKWIYGTYLWNNEQTEAYLYQSGLNKTINWIDGNGNGKVTSYRIPNNSECASCHSSDKTIIPIGPKLRNLNINVTRNLTTINQLQYFQYSGLVASLNPSSYSSLPNWQDGNFSVAERGRAYLDINCAHCHNTKGVAAKTDLFLGFEIPYSSTGISSRKTEIIDMVEQGKMPKLGTTIIDEEGLEQIKAYIQSLN